MRPQPGLLLMFPSWLSHAVRPYRGDGVRISIAINMTPAPSARRPDPGMKIAIIGAGAWGTALRRPRGAQAVMC